MQKAGRRGRVGEGQDGVGGMGTPPSELGSHLHKGLGASPGLEGQRHRGHVSRWPEGLGGGKARAARAARAPAKQWPSQGQTVSHVWQGRVWWPCCPKWDRGGQVEAEGGAVKSERPTPGVLTRHPSPCPLVPGTATICKVCGHNPRPWGQVAEPRP